MPTVETGVTELQLIENLPSIGTISNTDLALIQTSVQSYKTTFQNLVANIPDNTTIETNPSGKLRIKDASTTFSKIQNITGPSVIGRTDSGSGVTKTVSIDTDLSTVSSSHDTIASAKAIKTYVDTKTNFAQEEGSQLIGGGDVSGQIIFSNQYSMASVSVGFDDGAGGPPNGESDSPNGFAGWVKSGSIITGFKWTFGSSDNDNETLQWSVFGILN
jgi:hypothetical protein